MPAAGKPTGCEGNKRSRGSLEACLALRQSRRNDDAVVINTLAGISFRKFFDRRNKNNDERQFYRYGFDRLQFLICLFFSC